MLTKEAYNRSILKYKIRLSIRIVLCQKAIAHIHFQGIYGCRVDKFSFVRIFCKT